MHSTELIGGSLDDVVKESNFSHGHLCRLFKKYTGERIIDVFSRIKMQHACRLYYVTGDTNAYISGKVINTLDLGTHTMFIADVTDAEVLQMLKE